MKKGLLILIALVFAFSAQSCHKINGSGPVVTETRNVSDFTAINVGIHGNVYYIPGPEYKVEIHAQKNIIDILETRVSGAELKLEFNYNKYPGIHDPIDVYITAPSVNALTITGSGNLKVTEPISSTNFDTRISGSGSITVAGLTASYLTTKISGSGDIHVNGGTINGEKVEISGSGDVDLLNVAATSVETHTSGSGTAKVNVSDNLDVHISGSGDVYYKGRPAINTHISGSGKIIAL